MQILKVYFTSLLSLSYHSSLYLVYCFQCWNRVAQKRRFFSLNQHLKTNRIWPWEGPSTTEMQMRGQFLKSVITLLLNTTWRFRYLFLHFWIWLFPLLVHHGYNISLKRYLWIIFNQIWSKRAKTHHFTHILEKCINFMSWINRLKRLNIKGFAWH